MDLDRLISIEYACWIHFIFIGNTSDPIPEFSASFLESGIFFPIRHADVVKARHFLLGEMFCAVKSRCITAVRQSAAGHEDRQISR
ncbi:hypothetical protein [Novosphingobium sp. FSW06-99]|uniref:hypothetical protein n=1 Tax=Novosphingobium sp. FSW06-99 TaxID=1739113 RepID=UPI0012E38310|nr:hypothetical protein [Novosphingobium sp. FSW06-99]